MDKIARVRQEIERQKAYAEQMLKGTPHDLGLYYVGWMDVASKLSVFLDTLPEEPDKSLEEAAYKYSFDSRPSIYGQVDVIDAFIAGAEWKEQQMLKDAVEGKIYGYGDGSYELVASWLDLPKGGIYKDGDKVRIVVLKEDEE